MEPNIALILNWSQAPIGMDWSKLGVFLCLPSMALKMSYGKNKGKFKPKIPALQGVGQGEKKILKEKFSFSTLKD
jgi:hypothetical protein